MSKVTFFPRLKLDTQDIADQLKSSFIPNNKVIIKLHFGEPGNETAFKPKHIKPYTDALKELGFEFAMLDTPVNYSSPRQTKEGYEKAARERGYDKLGEIIISDTYVKQKVGDLEFEVAKELAEANNVLVISHVKGHECAGFGGAVKNLGMGALSGESKGLIHNASKPEIDKETCTGCGTCVSLCPAKAISLEDGKADPDLSKCWGCSICEINCPVDALKPQVKLFDEALAMGAVAAIKQMPAKTTYINIIQNITKSCDCESNSGDIIASDVGVLFSENPAAIDNASIDLIRQKDSSKPFIEVNNKDPKLQINYTAEYSDFETEYELDQVKNNT